MDRTLLKENGSFVFYRWLVKKGVIPFWTLPAALFYLVQYRFGNKGLAGLHRSLFEKILKGAELPVLEKEVDQFLDANLARLISPSVAARLDAQSAILSSSPIFLVSKIAKRLGISLFAGTEYEIDNRSRLCEIRYLVTGIEKLEIAIRWCKERGIPREQTVAWSDSLDDLPLLNWVGTVIAVRPTSGLKKVAMKNKWQIWNED